jgi:drug/metabolite transporter (DMT)-like permease
VRGRPAHIGLLLALAVIWGLAFLFVDLGLDAFSPVLYAALRFDIAGPLLLAAAYLWHRGRLLPQGRAQWSVVLWTAGLNILGYHVLLYWGQLHTYEAVASVIVGLNPILTTVFSRAILPDERVGLMGLVGLAVGLGGIAVLAALKGGALFDLQGLGELACAGGVACWAMGTVVSRRIDHKMPAANLTAWQMVVGAAMLHPLAFVLEGGGRADWTQQGTFSLLYLALVSSGVGYFLFFYLVPRLGPIRTAVVSTLTPISATAAGVIVLNDPVEARMLIAFALIVISFLLVVEPWKARRRSAPSPAAPDASGGVE